MNGSVAASGALSVISAMVTPALMILAAASLASSALLRMGRIVDRARLLALMVHEGKLDQLGASSDVVARWLKTYRARAQRTALAVFVICRHCSFRGSVPPYRPSASRPRPARLRGARSCLAGRRVSARRRGGHGGRDRR